MNNPVFVFKSTFVVVKSELKRCKMVNETITETSTDFWENNRIPV